MSSATERRQLASAERAAVRVGARPERLILALLGALALAALALRRHDTLHSTAFDLAIFANVLWNTVHGVPFASWMPPFAFGNYLTEHFSPILVLFAIPYAVWPDPRLLITLQAAIIALGALPVGNLAERRLKSRVAGLVFAGVYFAYPFAGYLAVWDFHQECVLLAGLLFAFDLADRRRFGWMLVALALALTTKEEAGIAVAAFGVFLALHHRRWLLGGGLAVVGFAWFALAIGVVIPHFREGLPFVYSSHYAHLGATPLDVARNVIFQPQEVLALVTTPDRLAYLRDLFAPLPLALLGPLPLLASLPVLAGNLLSAVPEQYRFSNHYAAGVVPGILVGAIEGARVLARLLDLALSRATRRRRVGSIAAVFVAALSLAIALVVNPASNALADQYANGTFVADPARDAALAKIAPLVPPEAGLATTWHLAPRFTSRPVLTTFPQPLVNTEYLLVDLTEGYSFQYPRDIRAAVAQAETDGYVEVAREGSLVLLRWGSPPRSGGLVAKGEGCGEALARATSQADAEPPCVVVPVTKRFGDGLELESASYAPTSADGRVRLTLRWHLDAPTAQLYGVRLRLASRGGEGDRLWWYGLAPRVAPWSARDPGGAYVDAYDLALPEGANLLSADLIVEPYRWPAQSFLPTTPGDEGRRLPLHVASAGRLAAATVEQIGAPFGDVADLERANIERREVAPGEALAGTLGFRALAATDAEYRVSVQLVGERGLVAQQDGPPAGGVSPTSGWRPGDWIEHSFALVVPPGTLAGHYRLIAVLYDGKSGARLPVGKESFATVGDVVVR